MNTVTATIDISKPAGRKIVKDLERKKCVKLDYSDAVTGTTYTHQEVWSKMEKRLNDFYGTDYKLNYRV